MQKTSEILVAGTGPVGLAAALAFAGSGFDVALVGPPVRADDRRTTALMAPALKLLDSLGVLDAIRPKTAPLRTMRIIDATGRLIRSPIVTFRASEIGEEEFGLNMPNTALLEALEAAVEQTGSITWLKALVARWTPGTDKIGATLVDGTELSASLAAAADGRASPARNAAGIRIARRDLPQAALVLNFSHSRDHEFNSTEFHTETGPFTQVPLPGRRSSLVWVVGPDEAERLATMDDAVLSMQVEERMQSMLGKVAVEPGRQVYPLSATLPDRFARDRIALAGEAAHVFPPIGAQGLNLGLRDVEDLVRVAEENRADPGSPDALAAYDRRRRPDITARAAAVNLLNRSLLSDFLPSQLARSAGLGLLGGIPPLRGFFMREGLKPGSGFAALFGSGKKVGRQ